MSKRRHRKATDDSAATLKKRLERLEKHRDEYLLKQATFGIYSPPHVVTEIERLNNEIVQLKQQVSKQQNQRISYRLPRQLGLLRRNIGDLFVPFDQAARRRRRTLINRFKSTFSVLVAGGLIALCLLSALAISVYRYMKIQLVAEPIQIPVPQAQLPVSLPDSSSEPPGPPSTPTSLRTARVVTPLRIGVLYRTAPRDNAVDTANRNGPAEGETVSLIAPVINDFGESWWQVQLRDGRVGYIREQFLNMDP